MKGAMFMQRTIVEMKHVSISFQDTKALKDLNFSMIEGETFGFLGPSGAGKTTTIKLLTKQLKANEGEIMLMGKDLNEIKDELFFQIGVLTDNSGIYEKLTVYENLKIFADLKRIDSNQIDTILKKTGLWEARKKKAKDLSKGMKQRLLFSRAILHKPKILFLDEPTSALDPATAEEIYRIIADLKQEGTTIFLTTHNMNEADLLCDRVAFLNQGHIVECGNPDDLKLKHAGNEVIVYSDTGKQYHTTKEKESLKQVLQDMDGNVLRIHSIEPDLKTIFLDMTGRELM